MNTEATSGGVQRPERPATSRRRFSRGAAILPSLFTTGNLFLGFWAIVRTFHGQYAEAAPLIFWAILLDVLDGRIARLTGTTSEFGAELDSLADVVSFGVAPALLAYSWGFGTLPRVGWLVAFLFIVCVALLLIVFNMHPGWCLLALATLFWLSGPLAYLWGLVFRRRPGPPPVVAAS